jgi:hypothetical protein
MGFSPVIGGFRASSVSDPVEFGRKPSRAKAWVLVQLGLRPQTREAVMKQFDYEKGPNFHKLKTVSRKQVEAAFDHLIRLGMIQQNPANQQYEHTPAGIAAQKEYFKGHDPLTPYQW